MRLGLKEPDIGGRGQSDRRGWVGAEGAGTEAGADDTRLERSDAESSESGFGGGDISGLAAVTGWRGCRRVYTLRATLESKEIRLTLICHFAVQPGSRLHLSVKLSARSNWGFLGGRHPAAARLQACMSFPWAALSSPATVVATDGGGRDVRAFPLVVLPTGPAQVPVLANYCTVQGLEDRPTRIKRVLSPSQRDKAGRCEL